LPSPIYRKTAYELVREAAYELGKGGKTFTYQDVLSYIRSKYPDAPHKDDTIEIHLWVLSINNKSAANFHPSLYKRAFLIDLGGGRFKLAERGETSDKEETEKSDDLNPEEIAKEKMENYFGVRLEKKRLNIFGKYKEFDLVNIEENIVGDVKHYTFKGSNPAAQFSTISEYVWLMEKLEQSSGKKWRKFIVGLGNRETFVKYAKQYGPWLGDIEIYFIDENGKLETIRAPSLGI